MSIFTLHAYLAGIGVALLAGMLGPFIVWRRMAYMGDAMSHVALLGVALGFLIGINPAFAVLLVALVAAFLLNRLQRDRRLPSDAILALIATGGLAAGFVLFSWLPNRQVDLFGYLFGDILAVRRQDLWLIYGALAFQGLFVARYWRPLMRLTIHEEIARVEGVPVGGLQLLMTVLIAVTVAMALQVVGMLLITALLVIPPLVARLLAFHPALMVWGSMLTGVVSAVSGVYGSKMLNISAGPMIVLCAVALFVAVWLGNTLFRKWRH